MSAKLNAVGDDDVIAHDAVVSNVHVGHQQTVTAHFCLTAMRGATIHGHAFAQYRSIADDGKRRLAVILQVLRGRTNNDARMQPYVLTDARAIGKHDVR